MEPTLQNLINRLNDLSEQFNELREGIGMAIDGATRDPEMALIRSRKVLEYVVRDVFQRRVQEPPGTRPLESLIQRLVKDGYLPPRLEAYTETIRKLGNVGAHQFGQKIRAADVYQSLTQLMPILEWFFEVERPEAGVRLDLPDEIRFTETAPNQPGGDRASKKQNAVLPKGLRSFDASDSAFFLQLLPGPRDQDGLPESIRFWKHRIEATDDPSFTVGVIYGPSGCGKSSLVKAGLLPRLAKRITSVYVEATPDETETRLLNGLGRKLASLPADLDLRETISAIRQGQGLRADQKVVMVIDQFEQWLHANRHKQDTGLAQALRQCDGERVQCVVMVRDDFWMALTRFMSELGIELHQGRNAASVDLFDLIHARHVLAAFGRSYGRLPESPESPTGDQETFLADAVEGLSQDGRVISIRLALFAEMVKGKAWTPATLKAVGGTEGVGVTFLEETFGSATLRSHQKAAQAVLKALLPGSGTDIKGHMRSHDELREASGCAERPREFDDLLRILDSELRLITPTDPEGSVAGEQPAKPQGVRFFQLTHDYLVHSLRHWLTRKQRETRKGRAELRLAERSAVWSAKPENRHLPSALEWANIRLLTTTKDWSELQTNMMRRAGRVHVLRGLGLAVLIALVTWAGVEGYGTVRASSLVESLKTASTADVEPIIKHLSAYRRWAKAPLVRLLGESEKTSREHLHASLALLPLDASQGEYLYDRLLNSNPIELPVIWKLIQDNHQAPVDRLWKVLDDPKADRDQRFRSACALAFVDAAADKKRWDAVSGFVTDRLMEAVLKNPSHYSSLIKTLQPVCDRLMAPLSRTSRDQGKLESERSLATSILSDYAAERPDVLADLLMDATGPQFAMLFPKVQAVASQALTVLESEVARKPTPEATEDDKDKVAQRQARAAVALVRLGRTERIWPLLRHSADPRLRSFIVNWLAPLGADPKLIVAEFDRLHSLPIRKMDRVASAMDGILFHPETSIRRALILAVAAYGTDGLSPGEREPLVGKLLDLYRNDPDAGIHGAAEWALRQWRNDEKLKAIDTELSKLKDRGERRWLVNSQGQTFAVIEGPVEFLMGSPPAEPEHDSDETTHRVVIPRAFAIAAKEVSKEQWQAFAKQNPDWDIDAASVNKFSPDPNGPMIGFSWYTAAAFCNWLSEQEGLPKEQWCYLPAENGNYTTGMTIPADVLLRKGYRLPTEAEWEFACRSGTTTSRYYGLSLELLDGYARYQLNSKGHAWTCGSLRPNDFGLFDMLGNMYEWVQDEEYAYKAGQADATLDSIKNISHVNDTNRVLRGGAFVYESSFVRAAHRPGNLPVIRSANYGFRPARTYP